MFLFIPFPLQMHPYTLILDPMAQGKTLPSVQHRSACPQSFFDANVRKNYRIMLPFPPFISFYSLSPDENKNYDLGEI